jgi:hypothetical protein
MKEILIQILSYFAAYFICRKHPYRIEKASNWKSILLPSILFFIFSALLHRLDHWLVWSFLPSTLLLIISALIDKRQSENNKLLTIGFFLQLFAAIGPVFFYNIDLLSIAHNASLLDFRDETYWYILAYIICLAPANILIKAILKNVTPHATQDNNNAAVNESLERAGRLIGSLERALTLTLVFTGQFEAIGFVIAAKSIIRTKDNRIDSEYLLLGTLISFGIAIGLGLITLQLVG